jgi:DNA polymerase-1
VPTPAEQGPRVVIVDGTNTLYRAFFAIPALRASDGTPTNAAYGFVNMLLKTLREEAPDFLVVVFDARGRTFRHERFADYKATRDAQPEDLSAQIPLVRELVDAYRFPVLEVPGFEADDVIATLIDRAPADAHVTVVSTDRDLMQLVGDRVTLVDGIRDRRYGPAEVEERFGVPPSRVIDVRALLGDTSDNIPGVKGIGEKSAAKLIREWGDLDNLLAHVDEVTPPRARTALAQGVEAARLSRELATLRVDAPVPDFAELAVREPDVARLRELFSRLGFTRLLDGLAAGAAGAAPAARPAAAPVAVEVAVEVVASRAALEALVPALRAARPVPIVLIADGAGVVGCRPVGIALGLGAERAAYVPLGPPGPSLSECAPALRAAFAADDPAPWLAADAKRVHAILAEHGIELPPPCFDVEIAGALLDATGAHHVQALASRYLSRQVASFEDLAGRGARSLAAAELSQATLSRFAGETAAAVGALVDPLRKRLSDDELAPLFHEVECPLTVVLSRMERAGVKVDERRLAELSVEYERDLARIEGEIYALAGERFLVSSPKQLQTILFEKLKLPVVRKTKTGFSTDEGVLEQLAAHHELPARILAHRRLAKLKNTYVDALPPLVNRRTGRIHPTFHQLGAATGRLSAANPNVQNIPIRSEEGARIREAFVAEPGRVLLSADYSQVELRILAHFSRDESLIAAFRQGDDIHRRTAAAVWGVTPEAVTADQRARAKAVNFGIIYGLSAFGLANQLGIASGEAQQTIDTYFERYRGVRRFIDETIAGAQRDGFVRTLLGRRRYLPDLRSRNRALRQAAERMAVNTVIQGTQADLIKKAMLAVDAGLRAGWPEARMILQVHDELVFEVPAGDADAIARQLEVWMQDVLPLGVPLAVEVGRGRHWREAH